MKVFKSWREYWDFSVNVRFHERYIHTKETQEFLNTVVYTIRDRRKRIIEKTILWRAQLGHDEDKANYHMPIQYHFDRMKPMNDKAREGRANPKGIPHLYLATDKNTAISEVRPGVGSYVSVAKFVTKKELSVIDCSNDRILYPKFYWDEPGDNIKEQHVWSDINEAFSSPVNPTEDLADYAPTQILADLFKREGYDGIVYESSLGEGKNVVLFDIDVADAVYCELQEVKSVKIESELYTNPSYKK